ncbi:MAG: hypothetical protein Q9167_000640 [Letrouitia subvulpina]
MTNFGSLQRNRPRVVCSYRNTHLELMEFELDLEPTKIGYAVGKISEGLVELTIENKKQKQKSRFYNRTEPGETEDWEGRVWEKGGRWI